MVKAVSVAGARRSLYLDQYMYVLAGSEIVALDQRDWSEAGKLTF